MKNKIPPFPASGQGIKHPNFERNVMIAMAVYFISVVVFTVGFTFGFISREIPPTKTSAPTKQEQFNQEARILRSKAIEEANKNEHN